MGRTKTIKVDELSVTETKDFAELAVEAPKKKPVSKKSKSTAKSAVSEKSEGVEKVCSSSKTSDKSTEKTGKQRAKTGAGLVDKKAKQSGVKEPNSKDAKISDLEDTCKSKKAVKNDVSKPDKTNKKCLDKADKPVKNNVSKDTAKTNTNKEKKKAVDKEDILKPAVDTEESVADKVAKAIESKKAKLSTETKEDEPKKKEKKSTTPKKPAVEEKKKKPAEKTATLEEVKKPVYSGIDLLISFDTTGSMYPVLSQVRSEVSKLVKDTMQGAKDVRIGIIAHGDYCDANNPYTIRVLDFTNCVNDIVTFVNETDKTCGGDADECYELVLNTARTVVDWGAGRNKVMLMIGDAEPHGVTYPLNKTHLDWKNEAQLLGEMGVKVFAVHALSYYRQSSKNFYKTVAEQTGGTYLTLDQFNEVSDLIRATCFSQSNEETLNEFVSIIRNNGKLTNSMARNINRLYGREVIEGVKEDYTPTPRKKSTSRLTTDDTLVQADGLVAIAPGRFQTMTVPEDCAIKAFVLDNGIEFKKGRAFYELSKSEKVQQYKEVIIQDRKTGEMFNGAQVREYLGLQPQIAAGGVTENLNSHHTKDFRVFVQSTSVNRKLIGGTEMLYEIAD